MTKPVARRRIAKLGCLILAIVVALGGWWAFSKFRRVVDDMMAAEYRLHAVWKTADLVEDWVERHDSWPRSWDDLLSLQQAASGSAQDVWPSDFPPIQDLVIVDFSADLAAIRQQTESDFKAIRPAPGRMQFVSPQHLAGFLERIKTVPSGPARDDPKVTPPSR